MATIRMRPDGSFEIIDDGNPNVVIDGFQPMDAGPAYTGPDFPGAPSTINVASHMNPDEFYYVENQDQFDAWRNGTPYQTLPSLQGQGGGGGGAGGGIPQSPLRNSGAGPREFWQDDFAPTRVNGPSPDTVSPAMTPRQGYPVSGPNAGMSPTAYLKGPTGNFQTPAEVRGIPGSGRVEGEWRDLNANIPPRQEPRGELGGMEVPNPAYTRPITRTEPPAPQGSRQMVEPGATPQLGGMGMPAPTQGQGSMNVSGRMRWDPERGMFYYDEGNGQRTYRQDIENAAYGSPRIDALRLDAGMAGR